MKELHRPSPLQRGQTRRRRATSPPTPLPRSGFVHCRKPRATREGLWGFRFSTDFGTGVVFAEPGRAGGVGAILSSGGADELTSLAICNADICNVRDYLVEQICFPRHSRREAMQGQTVPDHGTHLPAGVGTGGARGWRQRSKNSMTTMRPPQHGHGGRVSGGSTGASAPTGSATASNARACARLLLRLPLASRP